MKWIFWLQLGLVILLGAFLFVRRRRFRKRQVIQDLYHQGANDCATLHPFNLEVVHEATLNNQVDPLQAQEAYRRGYVNEDAKLALRDLASVQAQLRRETNKLNRRPAQDPV